MEKKQLGGLKINVCYIVQHLLTKLESLLLEHVQNLTLYNVEVKIGGLYSTPPSR